MTYALALSYLAGLNESRIKPGLERVREALSALGDPQLNYPQVLVGGTNGKGSVATFIGTALTLSGYRTGLFTSPHLNMFEERIVVDGITVGRDNFADLVQELKGTGVEMTYFEFATVMALLYFARTGVDLAVLEVGLGGRWDATNIVDPILSIITSVDLDHQKWLGTSLGEVARQKSGIMRKGRPVVLGPMEKSARDVVLEEAASIGARTLLFERDFQIRSEGPGVMRFIGKEWVLDRVKPGPEGRFQLDNAACSLAALEALNASGFRIGKEDAARGVETARWPGRFQKVPSSPAFIIDSAHNGAGVRALVRSLEDVGNVVWLYSALSDKDISGMAGEMAVLSRRFVLVPIEHPRASDMADLEKAIPEGARVIKANCVKNGIAEARRLAGEKGCIVVAGSVVLAGEALKILREDGYDV